MENFISSEKVILQQGSIAYCARNSATEDDGHADGRRPGVSGKQQTSVPEETRFGVGRTRHRTAA